MSTSKALLIVYHSMTDGTRQMAEVKWVRVEIPRIMAGVADLKVPLLAEIGFGPNWEKAH